MNSGDVQSRAQEAAILAMRGHVDAALATYERLLADVESGRPYFGEAELRSEFARLLHHAGDPREGPQLTKAVALFQRRGDVRGLVDACLRLAALHRHSETTAFYWVDRAVTAAERDRNPEHLALPLAARGELLLAFDRVEDALAVLQRAVSLPGGQVHAETLASAQVRAGQVRQGLDTLTRSLDDAVRAGETARVVSLTIRLADARRALGDRAGARQLLEGAAAQAANLGDGDTVVLLLDRLGHALLESGDATAAVEALERGVERLRKEPTPDAGLFASLYHNLGNALSAIGNQGGAVRCFTEACRLARSVNGLSTEALATFALANSAATLGDAARARAAYDEARGLAVRLQNRSLEAACLDSLGQLHAKAGEPGKSVDLSRRAALLHGEIGDHQNQHTDLLNLVQALLLLGETAAAREAIDQARQIADAHLERLPWQHALHEGQVSAREGRWPSARRSFDEAVARLESERTAFRTPNDQRRWAAQRVEAFEIAAAAAFEARDALAAWSYLEGNRARFLEAVSERRRRLPPGLSPEARQAYLAAADRLADLRWRRRERPEAVNPEFEAELEQANRAWLALDAGVERLRAEEEEELPPPPAPERLAECLSPGEAAVALHVATDWIGATAVGRERSGSLWWGCETDGGLTLAQLSRAVVGRADGDDATVSPAWQDLARLPLDQAAPLIARTCVMLRERVWPLVERVLDGRADALVLMPGRGLNVLPLHAAPTTDGRLAMDRWCVRYAPSLGLLARAGAAGALPPGRILGQAVNPTGDLRFAETEADGIRGSWRGETRDPLRGPEAQPDRVLPLFEEADALHFAGHGAFDPEDPMQSRLFCAPGTSGDVITLQTLLERVPATRARVVLLSACETGRVVAGDPLNDQLGLPGGLLIAGASAVLATHWKVDDFAACLVLSRAIELWERDSLDLERALAAAQAWLRGATVSTVRGWIEERIDASSAVNPELERAYAGLAGRRDTERLFSAAIFWAPFHVTGRAVRAH